MGVWIEMVLPVSLSVKFSSLPLVGVWIEITFPSLDTPSAAGHSPWWECGLKSKVPADNIDRQQVTPLGGSVD